MKKREYQTPSLQWREIEMLSPLALSSEIGGFVDHFDVRDEVSTMEEANENFWQ